ncbi:MAG: WD40 repeat domain-containing protein [Planctomycetes bacterium]|nr:WD40 repeat domain-containing protein [Planctomycetota bacterium]
MPHMTPPEVPPELRLSGRVRLERYTFLAFAAVLSILALAGVVEFKRNQADLIERCGRVQGLVGDLANAQVRLDRQQEQHRGETARLANQLDLANTRVREKGLDLGLALTRLALADADGDEAARSQAREVLAQADLAGAPAFMPLARWALADVRALALEFRGRHSGLPIDHAVISRDGEAFAVSRHDRGIEVFKTRERDLLTYIEPPGGDSVQSLALAPNLQLFTGWKQGSVTYQRVNPGSVSDSHIAARFESRQSVRCMGLSPSANRIAAADTTGALLVVETQPPHASIMSARLSSTALATCALDGADYDAAALCADGKLVLLKGPNGDSLTVHNFEAAPDFSAVGVWGGRVLAACARGDKIERLVVNYGKVLRYDEIVHGLGSVCYLAFSPDGALVAAGRGGQAARILWDGSVVRMPLDLGKPVRMAAVCRNGYLLAGAYGQITLSPDFDLILQGVRVAGRNEKTRVEVTPLGFALVPEEGDAFFWAAGERIWRSAGTAERVLPLWTTFASLADKQGRGPGGQLLPDAGMLIATVQSPQRAIFAGADGLIRCVDQAGPTLTISAPAAGIPDAAAAAGGAGDAVLLKYDRRLFRLRAVTGAIDEIEFAAAAPIALSADGLRAAFFNERAIQVIDFQAGPVGKAIAMERPAAVGLMFGGTVLVCLEKNAIAFYEVETGHLLRRLASDAINLAARDAELLIVTSKELRVLSFE